MGGTARCTLRGIRLAKRTKVIITCAVTGAGHTPTMSRYLPVTPEEIAEQSIAAAQAGAAMLHLHARDPKTGQPSADSDLFFRILPRIKERSDAVLIVNTGGVMGMPIRDRLSAPLRARPEMCSFNLGTMIIGLFPMLEDRKQWMHAWEPKHLESSRSVPTGNTFADIEYITKELGEGCGTRFEFECYDIGHLYNLAYLLDRGLVKPPLFIETAFGVLGGVGLDAENLVHVRTIADRLFGDDYVWSIMAVRRQMHLAAMGAIMGGSVRVGLEDSLTLVGDRQATSNAEQVIKLKNILKELALEVATPVETRTILHLKGADQVAF
jgi:3,5-dioxohexanoate:acetyl-CoA acetone transferase